ncbi:hypothetical protein JOM56_005629 [Amanita muscaria]
MSNINPRNKRPILVKTSIPSPPNIQIEDSETPPLSAARQRRKSKTIISDLLIVVHLLEAVMRESMKTRYADQTVDKELQVAKVDIMNKAGLPTLTATGRRPPRIKSIKMLFKMLSRHKLKTWHGTQSTAVLDKADMAANFLKPLKAFDSVVKGLANVHPYARVALSVLSWAALGNSEKAILAQANRDNVYEFMLGDGQLDKLISMKDVLSQASQVMLECAKIIRLLSTQLLAAVWQTSLNDLTESPRLSLLSLSSSNTAFTTAATTATIIAETITPSPVAKVLKWTKQTVAPTAACVTKTVNAYLTEKETGLIDSEAVKSVEKGDAGQLELVTTPGAVQTRRELKQLKETERDKTKRERGREMGAEKTGAKTGADTISNATGGEWHLLFTLRQMMNDLVKRSTRYVRRATWCYVGRALRYAANYA